MDQGNQNDVERQAQDIGRRQHHGPQAARPGFEEHKEHQEDLRITGRACGEGGDGHRRDQRRQAADVGPLGSPCRQGQADQRRRLGRAKGEGQAQRQRLGHAVGDQAQLGRQGVQQPDQRPIGGGEIEVGEIALADRDRVPRLVADDLHRRAGAVDRQRRQIDRDAQRQTSQHPGPAPLDQERQGHQPEIGLKIERQRQGDPARPAAAEEVAIAQGEAGEAGDQQIAPFQRVEHRQAQGHGDRPRRRRPRIGEAVGRPHQSGVAGEHRQQNRLGQPVAVPSGPFVRGVTGAQAGQLEEHERQRRIERVPAMIGAGVVGPQRRAVQVHQGVGHPIVERLRQIAVPPEPAEGDGQAQKHQAREEPFREPPRRRLHRGQGAQAGRRRSPAKAPPMAGESRRWLMAFVSTKARFTPRPKGPVAARRGAMARRDADANAPPNPGSGCPSRPRQWWLTTTPRRSPL